MHFGMPFTKDALLPKQAATLATIFRLSQHYILYISQITAFLLMSQTSQTSSREDKFLIFLYQFVQVMKSDS